MLFITNFSECFICSAFLTSKLEEKLCKREVLVRLLPHHFLALVKGLVAVCSNPYLLACRLSVGSVFSLVHSLVGKTYPIPRRYNHNANAGTKVHTKYNWDTRRQISFSVGNQEEQGAVAAHLVLHRRGSFPDRLRGLWDICGASTSYPVMWRISSSLLTSDDFCFFLHPSSHLECRCSPRDSCMILLCRFRCLLFRSLGYFPNPHLQPWHFSTISRSQSLLTWIFSRIQYFQSQINILSPAPNWLFLFYIIPFPATKVGGLR